MGIPEYTASLAIWIVPVFFLTIFFVRKKVLPPEKYGALLVTVLCAAGVGIVLDILFADAFFTFPNARAVCGITVRGIPIEEFAFYICGDWFIVFLYVFCNEWFLRKYSVPDAEYARCRSQLPRLVRLHGSSLVWTVAALAAGLLVKRLLNPYGGWIPGYFYFITLFAFLPMVLFLHATKSVVNWRAFALVLMTTLLISVIWEVTLALPRGWWGYQKGSMLGIFLRWWHDIPLEAILLWISSSLVILIYEFCKICFFTDRPSVPAYRFWVRLGYDWRVGERK